MKYLVSSILRFLHTIYYLLHTTSQRGFAPLALIIFLLFGIAAGTLLVQKGVNFLPKATNDCNLDGSGTCSCVRATDFYVPSGDDHNPDDSVCRSEYTFYKCSSGEERCYVKGIDPSSTQAQPAAAAPASNVKGCGFSDIDNGRTTFSRCDFPLTDDAITSLNLSTCRRISREVDFSQFKLWCKGSSAALPTAGGCTQAEIDKNPNKKDGTPASGCYKDTKGVVHYLIPEGAGCSEASKKTCGVNDCKIVRGEERCIYKGNGCIESDFDFCKNLGKKCETVTRDGNLVSACAEPCSPGWHNFCMIVKNKSCVVDTKGVPDCTGEPKTPAAAPAAAPAAPGRPAAPPAGQPAAAAPAARPAAPAECGFDKNDLSIPCFKIGVFNPEELTATEAQAKVALQRFNQYSQIISDLQGKIGTDLIAQAEARIKNGVEAANACIEGK